MVGVVVRLYMWGETDGGSGGDGGGGDGGDKVVSELMMLLQCEHGVNVGCRVFGGGVHVCVCMCVYVCVCVCVCA
jgi:hypothetical protein